MTARSYTRNYTNLTDAILAFPSFVMLVMGRRIQI